MMLGQFREYNWKDIQKLIYADAGLVTDEDRRTRGELWCVGGFRPPEHEHDTCIRLQTYDLPFSQRIKEHTKD